MGGAPCFGCVGDLDGVHERDVEELHDGIVEGVDVLDDGLEVGDGFGAWDVMGGELLLDGLQAGRVELFGFQAGEESGKKLEVLQGVLGGVEDGFDLFSQDKGDDGFDEEDGEEGSFGAGSIQMMAVAIAEMARKSANQRGQVWTRWLGAAAHWGGLRGGCRL